MARIEQADTSVSLGASLAGPRGLLRGRGATGAGQGFALGGGALAQGVSDVGAVALQGVQQLATVIQDQQVRRNERKVQDAMLGLGEARSRLLRGDGSPDSGFLNRLGSAADGVSQEAGTALMEHVRELELGLENDLQKQVFLRKARGVALETADLMSRHEASQLEKARQSNALALRTNLRRELATLDRYALLDAVRVEGGVDRYGQRVDGLIQEFEDSISAQMPELGDEAVASLARSELSQTALEATMGMLEDEGVSGIGGARRMLDTWGDQWDATERGGVRTRIEKEVGLAVMDDVVTGVWRAAGEEASPLRVSEAAGVAFQKRFRRETGSDAPDSLVQEAKRRAVTMVSLVDDELRRRADRDDTRLLGEVYAVFGDPSSTPQQREDALRLAHSKASDERPIVNRTLLQLQSNFEKTGGPFAPVMTREGFAIYAGMGSPEFKALSESEVSANAFMLPESEAKEYVRAWRAAQNAGGFTPSGNPLAGIDSDARQAMLEAEIDDEDDQNRIIFHARKEADLLRGGAERELTWAEKQTAIGRAMAKVKVRDGGFAFFDAEIAAGLLDTDDLGQIYDKPEGRQADFVGALRSSIAAELEQRGVPVDEDTVREIAIEEMRNRRSDLVQ